MRCGADTDERGAAVIDFVMMSTLLIFLLFGVLQVAVYFYARNVAASSAADAARYAAARGIDPRSGASRAQHLIGEALDDADASGIRCRSGAGRASAANLPVTTVRCTGRVRLLFSPLHLPLHIDVRSSVLREGVR